MRRRRARRADAERGRGARARRADAARGIWTRRVDVLRGRGARTPRARARQRHGRRVCAAYWTSPGDDGDWASPSLSLASSTVFTSARTRRGLVVRYANGGLCAVYVEPYMYNFLLFLGCLKWHTRCRRSLPWGTGWGTDDPRYGPHIVEAQSKAAHRQTPDICHMPDFPDVPDVPNFPEGTIYQIHPVCHISVIKCPRTFQNALGRT